MREKVRRKQNEMVKEEKGKRKTVGGKEERRELGD